jgi:hypothetical protein
MREKSREIVFSQRFSLHKFEICRTFLAGFGFVSSARHLIMPLLTRPLAVVDVPNVANLSWNAAEKVLRDKGLQAVKAAENTTEKFRSFVIFQALKHDRR